MEPFLVKGQSVQNTLRVWQSLLTPEELAIISEATPPEAMKILRNPPLAIAWVDGFLVSTFPTNVAQKLGARGLELIEQAGAAMLEQDLKTIYKVLMRITSVDFAIQRANTTYSTYVKNGGRLEAERLDPSTVVVHAIDMADRSESNMWFMGGTTLGVLRAAGAKNVHVAERKHTATGFDIVLKYNP